MCMYCRLRVTYMYLTSSAVRPVVDPLCGGGRHGHAALEALGAVEVVGPVARGAGPALKRGATVDALLGHLGVELAALATLARGGQVAGVDGLCCDLRVCWWLFTVLLHGAGRERWRQEERGGQFK